MTLVLALAVFAGWLALAAAACCLGAAAKLGDRQMAHMQETKP